MNIKVEILNKNNLEEIYNLTLKMFKELHKKEWFCLNEYSFFENIFNNNTGLYLGIKNQEDKIIAYSLLLFEDYFNIFKNGGTLDIIIVDKEYRGKGFQKILIENSEKTAIENNIEYLISTVHPSNIYSSINFHQKNYKIIDHVFKQNDKKYIRNLYIKYI